ncbi:MAG: TetR/AcrR family transcriptional regulator [Desertimonas sp.]
MAQTRAEQNAERSRATRRRIMDRARIVFEGRGYGAVSIADIVEAAGVARGTFYVHFDSKSEVFLAVVADVRQRLVDSQMRTAPVSTTLGAAVRTAIESYLGTFREVARMITLTEEVSLGNPLVREAWMQTRSALLGNTAHALERMRERGAASFAGSADTMAVAVGGMVERMGVLRYVHGFEFSDDEFFTVLTEAYLNAAGIDAAAPVAD